MFRRIAAFAALVALVTLASAWSCQKQPAAQQNPENPPVVKASVMGAPVRFRVAVYERGPDPVPTEVHADVNIVVSAYGQDGVAEHMDKNTGLWVLGPEILTLRQTTYEYRAWITPDIRRMDFVATGLLKKEQFMACAAEVNGNQVDYHENELDHVPFHETDPVICTVSASWIP